MPQFTHILSGRHLAASEPSIISRAAMNICVCAFMGACFQLLWVNTKECSCWILWLECVEFLEGTATPSSEVAAPFCIPTGNDREILLLRVLARAWWHQCLAFGPSDRCAVISHVVLICMSLMMCAVELLFSFTNLLCTYLLGEMSV